MPTTAVNCRSRTEGSNDRSTFVTGHTTQASVAVPKEHIGGCTGRPLDGGHLRMASGTHRHVVLLHKCQCHKSTDSRHFEVVGSDSSAANFLVRDFGIMVSGWRSARDAPTHTLRCSSVAFDGSSNSRYLKICFAFTAEMTKQTQCTQLPRRHQRCMPNDHALTARRVPLPSRRGFSGPV